jgi:ABC-type lipoprotein release transport system permease subunit
MTGSISKLAWRNLWRRKRRTFITASSIAFALFLSVTFTGFGDHNYTKMVDMSATMGYGHLTLSKKGYFESPSVGKRLSDTHTILNEVRQFPGVTHAAARIIGQGVFSIGGKSQAGLFIGMNPKDETPNSNLFVRALRGVTMAANGSLFEGTAGQGAIVGTKMAERMNLKIGKRFIFTTTDIDGDIVSEAMRVVVFFQTGAVGSDGRVVLIPIDTVRAMLRYNQNEATMVSVLIEDQRRADEMRIGLGKKLGLTQTAGVMTLNRAGLFGETVLSTWNETQSDIAGFVAVDRAGNYLFQLLMGLMIAAGILNTIMMSVLERKQEFGVVMAIGTSPRQLFLLIMMESVWLFFVGVLLGFLITTPWLLYMGYTGIDLSHFLQEGGDVGGVSFLVDPVLKIRLFQESVFVILGSIFGLTMLAGIYPAWKASRLQPIEAIRG